MLTARGHVNTVFDSGPAYNHTQLTVGVQISPCPSEIKALGRRRRLACDTKVVNGIRSHTHARQEFAVYSVHGFVVM